LIFLRLHLPHAERRKINEFLYIIPDTQKNQNYILMKTFIFIDQKKHVMKNIFFCIVVLVLISCNTRNTLRKHDWLIDGSSFKSVVTENDGFVTISNGLISRTISLSPDGATTGFSNLMTGNELIRAVKPEAILSINGKSLKVGGLTGQPVNNYLTKEWIESLKADSLSPFMLSGYKPGEIAARFAWKKRAEWMPQDMPWPPKGKQADFIYVTKKNGDVVQDIEIVVHYEIYDGLPLLCKWITVKNESEKEIIIDSFTSEILALTEEESAVGDKKNWILPNLYVETDYAFGGSMSSESCFEKSVWWIPDPEYKTIVNYNRIQPSMLECRPMIGPAERVEPGKSFDSFRTWILVNDSWDRERKGLAQRKMYRTISPWITENPIFMHLRYSDNESVKKAIEQCVETGFEKIILSFGSGFNIEDTSRVNLERYKELTEYAHSKGISLGGYSLLASRKVGGGNDVVMPDGQQPTFGNSPCIGSNWGEEYFKKLYRFIEYTGFDNFEHDGSYPGDVCIATTHPGHEGLADSQWEQFRTITDFYKWCRARGVYLTVPDWYFLNGSSKTGMGYRETNWSLPRRQQEIIERENIYDGTWEKTPSMGWMHVPLVEYQGGGSEATIEPLKEHLPHYGQRLADLFGAGVQAAYRGSRLYDAPETLELVRKWVTFYKKHRAILDADIIHIKRADGREIDAILHVSPSNNEKGLLMVYNPLDHAVKQNLTINVYYTGLDRVAYVTENDGKAKRFSINRNYEITIPVNIEPNSQSWYIIK
jgi:hypothetical protein